MLKMVIDTNFQNLIIVQTHCEGRDLVTEIVPASSTEPSAELEHNPYPPSKYWDKRISDAYLKQVFLQ